MSKHMKPKTKKVTAKEIQILKALCQKIAHRKNQEVFLRHCIYHHKYCHTRGCHLKKHRTLAWMMKRRCFSKAWVQAHKKPEDVPFPNGCAGGVLCAVRLAVHHKTLPYRNRKCDSPLPLHRQQRLCLP